MSSVLADRPAAGGYRAVLLPAHLPALLGAAFVGRLSYGTAGLAILLLAEHSTGSYTVAGAAVAAFGVAAALLAPARTRWAQRGGYRRILPILAAGYGAVLIAVAEFGERLGSAPIVLIALCALAGSLAPPLGPVTRGVWSGLLDHRDLVRRAYSVDATADEVLFTLGPLVSGVLFTVAGPQAGVLVTAELALLGTFGMIVSPLCRSGGIRSAAEPPRRRTGPLSAPRFRRLLVVMFGVGTGLGSIEMVAVGFAQQLDGSIGTGALLATIALGSAVGGVLYGHRSWLRPLGSQLAVLSGALSCALLVALLVLSTLPLLMGAMFLCGLCIAPALVAGYTLADRLSTAVTRTEAGTLINTVNNLGTAAGTAVAGVVLDHAGLRAALLVAAVAVAVAALGEFLEERGHRLGGVAQDSAEALHGVGGGRRLRDDVENNQRQREESHDSLHVLTV